MPTCAQVCAQTLRGAGITRMFGFPGGEILDFIDACRVVGIEFLLVRDEATAAFMADVTGQIQRQPGVCVSTLGPGALNMALGVANAYLDRSPVIAVTASIAEAARPYATHQNVDLNAIYRPFTKLSITLDGENTAAKIAHACHLAVQQPMGPVHIALPSDVARRDDILSDEVPLFQAQASPPSSHRQSLIDMDTFASTIREARRPVLIVGHTFDQLNTCDNVVRFAKRLGVPVFVSPKAKGILREDHPLFCGVCAGVAGDATIVDFLRSADLLVGVGYDPVESDKIWHHTIGLISIGPVSIATADFCPAQECIGDLNELLPALCQMDLGSDDWSEAELSQYRTRLNWALRPSQRPQGGLSPYEVTSRLRQLLPSDTIHVTDVGSVKFITAQAWETYEPLTFFTSNGLSSMGYGVPAAMAAKLLSPDRVVLCTMGDGGFGMTLSELETCVREGIHFVTVVYNDNGLSLIRAVQERKRYPRYGVEFGDVDYAVVAAAFGAWSARVDTMDDLDWAVKHWLLESRPVVLDVAIDPAEYAKHAAPVQ